MLVRLGGRCDSRPLKRRHSICNCAGCGTSAIARAVNSQLFVRPHPIVSPVPPPMGQTPGAVVRAGTTCSRLPQTPSRRVAATADVDKRDDNGEPDRPRCGAAPEPGLHGCRSTAVPRQSRQGLTSAEGRSRAPRAQHNPPRARHERLEALTSVGAVLVHGREQLSLTGCS